MKSKKLQAPYTYVSMAFYSANLTSPTVDIANNFDNFESLF